MACQPECYSRIHSMRVGHHQGKARELVGKGDAGKLVAARVGDMTSERRVTGVLMPRQSGKAGKL